MRRKLRTIALLATCAWSAQVPAASFDDPADFELCGFSSQDMPLNLQRKRPQASRSQSCWMRLGQSMISVHQCCATRQRQAPRCQTSCRQDDTWPLLRVPEKYPYGYAGPSGVAPTERQTSSHFVPLEDRWRLGAEPSDRYGKGHPVMDDYPA